MDKLCTSSLFLLVIVVFSVGSALYLYRDEAMKIMENMEIIKNNELSKNKDDPNYYKKNKICIGEPFLCEFSKEYDNSLNRGKNTVVEFSSPAINKLEVTDKLVFRCPDNTKKYSVIWNKGLKLGSNYFRNLDRGKIKPKTVVKNYSYKKELEYKRIKFDVKDFHFRQGGYVLKKPVGGYPLKKPVGGRPLKKPVGDYMLTVPIGRNIK